MTQNLITKKLASILSFTIAATVVLTVVSSSLRAESPTIAAPTPTALPKSGSLASSFTGGSSGGTSKSWGSEILDKAVAPIGGSVSKAGTSWIAKVFNNSDKAYSADVKMVQINARGTVARNDYFSVSLAAGQSTQRSFSVANGAVSADLSLSGWKAKGGPEKKPEEKTDAPKADPALEKLNVPDSSKR